MKYNFLKYLCAYNYTDIDIDITNNNLSSDTDESSEKCKTILINIL